MPKKAKRVVKSKEEIIKELRGNQMFIEKMKFTKEVFYPAVVKASKSVEDALSFLSSINSITMEQFLGYMKEKNMGELKLADKLDPKDEKYEELKEMLALFDNKSVFEAKELIEGMNQEINLFLREENRSRPLSDLKTRWIDDIVKEK